MVKTRESLPLSKIVKQNEKDKERIAKIRDNLSLGEKAKQNKKKKGISIVDCFKGDKMQVREKPKEAKCK